MIRKSLFAFAAMFLTLSYAHAQYLPAGDVSLSYSRWQAYNGCDCGVNGLKGGAAFNLNRWFGVTADLGYYTQNVSSGSGSGASSNAWATTFLAGPRFTFRNRSRVSPFIDVQAGVLHASVTVSNISQTQSSALFASGVGADVALDRGGHLALRPEVRILEITSSAFTNGPVIYSVGLAYRFGGRTKHK
jgi:hypothetical protein